MGDVAVSALVGEVVGRLTSIANQEFGLLRGFKRDVSALENTFRQIQAVLHDAEVQQRKKKAVEEWLRRLKAASFEVENVLDEVSTEDMLQRLDIERGIKYRVSAFFSTGHNPLLFRSRMAHKVKNIRKKLDAIDAEKSKFDLTPGTSSVDVGVGGDMTSRQTSSLVDESRIYGRDGERKMITETICSNDTVNPCADDVGIYAIWGMGGIGKTTLAQLVYNNERVKEHFELKSWVCVSDDFNVVRLTRGILESIEGRSCDLSQLDAMQTQLQEKLRGKRFLLVLDDVWNEDQREWEKLRQPLSCGAKGSIVMVTTRSNTIATMMAKSSELMFQMGCLSDDDSWSLFKKLAFGVGREEANIRELEPIGKKIVEKCKGLPLAVKALGSLMWSKSDLSEWQRVEESEIWDIMPEAEGSILPALKLSYDNLLPHLKQCFAYCCLFPKDYRMSKDLLIELWMVNGFIPSRGKTDFYVLGEEIFNCLVWRSFFQDVHGYGYEYEVEEEYGRTCKMHDMMHDLAQSVMGEECSVIVPGMVLKSLDGVLHLSSYYLPWIMDLGKLRSLRSIFILGYWTRGGIRSQIPNHRYLRVLHMTGFEMITLPESICNLKHLRYLNISRSRIKVLPESIISLQNLQVLNLRLCRGLRELPKRMRYMKNLRNLNIEHCYDLKRMPVGMGQLGGLQRLSIFIVGRNSGERIGELGDLNLLGGKLEIRGLDNVTGLLDAKSANLKCKQNLSALTLRWTDPILRGNDRGCEGNVDEEVLEGLEPHSSLKVLKIWFYMGSTISASWIVNLRSLVKIEFTDCKRCECLPRLGKLPSLRILELYGMDALKCFHDDDTSVSYNTTLGDDILFPCLEKLDISSCHQLIALPNNLPKLKSLVIRRCLHLTRRCEPEIGEDWPKISHVPRILIDDQWYLNPPRE